jgi:hypothetical protein
VPAVLEGVLRPDGHAMIPVIAAVFLVAAIALDALLDVLARWWVEFTDGA